MPSKDACGSGNAPQTYLCASRRPVIFVHSLLSKSWRKMNKKGRTGRELCLFPPLSFGSGQYEASPRASSTHRLIICPVHVPSSLPLFFLHGTPHSAPSVPAARSSLFPPLTVYTPARRHIPCYLIYLSSCLPACLPVYLSRSISRSLYRLRLYRRRMFVTWHVCVKMETERSVSTRICLQAYRRLPIDCLIPVC